MKGGCGHHNGVPASVPSPQETEKRAKLLLSFKSSGCFPSHKAVKAPAPGPAGRAPHLACAYLPAAPLFPGLQPGQLPYQPFTTTGSVLLGPWHLLSPDPEHSSPGIHTLALSLPRGLLRPPYLENTPEMAFSITPYPPALSSQLPSGFFWLSPPIETNGRTSAAPLLCPAHSERSENTRGV